MSIEKLLESIDRITAPNRRHVAEVAFALVLTLALDDDTQAPSTPAALVDLIHRKWYEKTS